MSNLDIEAVRHRISQKFALPETQIDESIIGLFLAIEKTHDSNRTEIEKLRTQKNAVHYENASAAFWGEFASKGISIIAICLSVVVIASLLYNYRNDKILVKNLESIKNSIDVREDGFYIKNEHLEKQKDGTWQLITN